MNDGTKGGSELNRLRRQIDEIDIQLLGCLNQRAALVEKIKRVKEQNAGVMDPAFYFPDREADILKRVLKKNMGPLSQETIRHFFREVLSLSLCLQKKTNIAYYQSQEKLEQQAVMQHFGSLVKAYATHTVANVFRDVYVKRAEYGIVPIESSSEHLVCSTVENFLNFSHKICGEIVLQKHYCDLVFNHHTNKKVRHFYGDPLFLTQYDEWLHQRYPNSEYIAVDSDSEAVFRIQEKSTPCGAIVSELFSKHVHYKKNFYVEHAPMKKTRFLVIGRRDVASFNGSKTSVMLTTINKKHTVYDILRLFSQHEVHLTKLAYYLMPKENPLCIFWVDCDGHRSDKKINSVLSHIAACDELELSILGSYPKAV